MLADTPAPDGLARSFANPVDGSEMLFVPAGSSTMGSDGWDPFEQPAHVVQIKSAYYMSKCEVTNRQWKKFTDASAEWRRSSIDSRLCKDDYLKVWEGDDVPSGKDDRPVVYVSWYAAKAYCEWSGGRLPTEAEWEKACRAGSSTMFCYGDDLVQLSDYAWFAQYSESSPFPVGKKKPNRWGFHDMHGNVCEWVRSDASLYPYRDDDGRNDEPDGPEGNAQFRGGHWRDQDLDCRATRRGGAPRTGCHHNIGVRLCIPADFAAKLIER